MRSERKALSDLLGDMVAGQRRWLLAGGLLALTSALSAIGLLATAGWLIMASGLAGIAALAGTAVTLEIFAPGALIRFFALSRTVSRYLERVLVHEAIFRVLAQLRQQVFSRQARLPFPQLAHLRDGPLLARVMEDVERLEHAHASLLIPLASALLAGLALVLAISLLVAPVAGLLLGLGLLLIFLLMRIHQQGHYLREARKSLKQGRYRARLHDLLAAHQILQHADPAGRLARDMRQTGDRLQSEESRLVALAARLDAAIQLLMAAVLIGLLTWGYGHWPNDLSPAWLAMAALGILALAGIYSGLGPAVRRWAGIQVALRRLSPAPSEQARERQATQGQSKASYPAQWTLDNVSLRRGLTDQAILSGVSIKLDARSGIAILGPSGTGKSRLARLLLGLETPHAGQILWSGQQVQSWAESARLSNLALLEQRSTLLSATLRDNLSLANPRLDDASLQSALDTTGLSENGLALDDWLADEARAVSGGEARRIALIRTVLSPAHVIILDEPFRGLDDATRRQVEAWLLEQLDGRGLILLDHTLPRLNQGFPLTERLQQTLHLKEGQLHAQ